MTSSVGWLDYSEEHRQRMREVIDLFRDQDTIDEIGVGSVRDTFSDLLFPGLSTVQTRAKYFLFIPWVYRRIEEERVPSARARRQARRYQTELIQALERGGARGSEGIIGWDARENLQRLPSAVYWAGLKVFGIRLFSGSIEDYHRSLDSYYRRVRTHSAGEGSELAERLIPNWAFELPSAPTDLWEQTTIELSPDEATFLRERMMIRRPDSLLAALLHQPEISLETLTTPWEHPLIESLEDPTKGYVHHARLFAEVMHGAALAYNLMLAEHASEIGLSMGDADLVERYRNALNGWAEGLRARWGDVRGWDTDAFWTLIHQENPRVPRLTQLFVRRWIDIARADPERVVDLPQNVRGLIKEREQRLKKSRARLTNHRALEMWNGASGAALMTFRWPTARTMISDIDAGLGHA